MNTDKPKVSVIVPVYNAEKYLSECIKSIIMQSYRDIEIILVDDGSTDSSGGICDRYAMADDRIIVIHKINGGQSDARNAGMDIAKGDFITFVDSDDYYADLKTLEYCVDEILRNDKIGFVQFPINHPERVLKMSDTILKGKDEIYLNWIKCRSVTNYFCDKLFRGDLMRNIRFPKGMIFEDRYTFPNVIDACDEVILIPRGCYFYRQHCEQTTRQNISQKFLTDQIIADMNILCNIPDGMTDLYCMVYYRVLCNNVILMSTGGGCKLKTFLPSIIAIVRAKIPIGIRFRLVALKLMGYKSYYKIFGKN